MSDNVCKQSTMPARLAGLLTPAAVVFVPAFGPFDNPIERRTDLGIGTFLDANRR
ncbi:MAG: hypothetical protein ACREDM_16260 [Methylocella sp.]